MENLEDQPEPQIPNRVFEDQIYEHLPPLIKNLTDQFEGREKDIALLSIIGALSSCLPQVYGEYGGYSISSNLYIMIIAPPASGKGVMNYARQLVAPIHNKVYNDSLNEIQDCNDSKAAEKRKSGKNRNKEQNDPIPIICPPLEIKIIPANISAAEIYTTIKYAHYGGVIIESEADTLSAMFKQDWGNFSDVLRKAFHHEALSMSRKTDNFYIEIERPQLSLVLSGTPDQLQPLIKSRENGLFSRMIFYSFEEAAGWNNPFKTKLKGIKGKYEEAGKIVFSVYTDLVKKSDAVEFLLTEEQQTILNLEMDLIHKIVESHHSLNFTSNVKRHGLILFRLCMILSAFRIGETIGKLDGLVCTDEDFNVALLLTKQLLHHANYVSNNGDLDKMSENDENFLYSLKEIFTRGEAITNGKIYGISKRSVDEKLVKWRAHKFLQKVSHGKYKRVLK